MQVCLVVNQPRHASGLQRFSPCSGLHRLKPFAWSTSCVTPTAHTGFGLCFCSGLQRSSLLLGPQAASPPWPTTTSTCCRAAHSPWSSYGPWTTSNAGAL
eukprot:scaffold253938_cov23-Tisochrysis_lutea.AAC.3